MPREESPHRYDFFISRAGADAEVAREVADVLRDAGHTVQYQDEDIPAGSNFIDRMSALVESCKHLLLILSPAYLDSPYCREEWTNFLADMFQDQGERRVVVILAANCKPPGILRARVFGSLEGASDVAERRDIILAAADGRARRIKIPPPIFESVPVRNPAFCGREEEISTMRSLFSHGQGSVSRALPIAIVGKGGVGKSSLAAEYAHRHAGDYWGVWWIPAESRTTAEVSLAELALRVDPAAAGGGSPSRANELLAKSALARIGRTALPWLLVYDNATSPDTIAGLLPPGNAHVLITSRWADWQGVAAELRTDVLKPEVAQAYLLGRAGSSDAEGAERLTRALGFLPLALDQAGAFCKRSGLSFDDYARRATEFIRMRPSGSGYPRSVFATFSLCMDDAASRSFDAERLMSILAFLSPDNLPLVAIGPDVLDLPERVAALEALTAVSLVAVEDGKIRMHRLVQEVMRQRVHEIGGFEGLRPVIHKALSNAVMFGRSNADLTEQLVFENVLWALHYDPSPQSSLEFVYPHVYPVEISLTFEKRSDGIHMALRGLDAHDGQPLYTFEHLYFLQEEWKSKRLRGWVR